MQNYQNYLINPYMQQGYPQLQQTANPYMERFSQFQTQPMPQMQMPVAQGIVTRIVDDFSLITANDVPMDGTGAFFTKKDGSEIQHRTWTAQGTIAQKTYKPVLEEQPSNLPTDSENMAETVVNRLEQVLEKQLLGINDKLDKFEKAIKLTGTKRKDADNE